MVQARIAEESASAAESSSKRTPIVLIVGMVAAITIAITLSLVYLIKPKFLSPSLVDGEQEAAEPEKQEAVYTPLPDPLLLTYLQGGRTHYVKIQFSLMSRQADAAELIPQHKDRLRHEWLMALQQVPFKGLLTSAGKAALQTQALAVAQSIFKEEEVPIEIEQVLFTQFIIQ